MRVRNKQPEWRCSPPTLSECRRIQAPGQTPMVRLRLDLLVRLWLDLLAQPVAGLIRLAARSTASCINPT
eukprot:169401-Lingulodinium_polyedra.AAC.1